MKILFATDFSVSTEVARHEVIRLARMLAAEVVVVHVLPDGPFYSDAQVGLAAQRLHASHWRLAEKQLPPEIALIGAAAGVKVRGVVLRGAPAEKIVRVAADERADLIAMGTQGAGFLDRFIVGSVAGRVIRTAPCPVIGAPGGAWRRARGGDGAMAQGCGHRREKRDAMKIVYATDFSEGAEAARAQAMRLAPALGAEVIPLYVMSPTVVFGDESVGDYVTRLYEVERKLAEEKLESTAAAFRAAGLRVRPLVRLGVPAEQIVQVASDEQGDFIVMGTHGRGALGRLFVGSVASRVVETAPCAVVTVRAVDAGAAGSTGSRPVARVGMTVTRAAGHPVGSLRPDSAQDGGWHV